METSSGTDSFFPELRATNTFLRSEQTEYAKYREHFRRQSKELLEANEKLLSCLKERYTTYADLASQDTELDATILAKRKENHELSAQIALLGPLAKSKNRKKRTEKITRRAKKQLRVAKDNLDREQYEKQMAALAEEKEKREAENKELEKKVDEKMEEFEKLIANGKLDKSLQERVIECIAQMNRCAKLRQDLIDAKMKASELDVAPVEFLRALFGTDWRGQANVQSDEFQDLAKESSEKPIARKKPTEEFQYDYEYDYEYDGDENDGEKVKVRRKKKVLKDEQNSEKKEEDHKTASRKSRRKKEEKEEKEPNWRGRKSRKEEIRRRKESRRSKDDKNVPYSLLDEPLVTHSADPFEKPEDTDTYRNVYVADLDMQTNVGYLEPLAAMTEEHKSLLTELTNLQKDLCDKSKEVTDVDEQVTQLREQYDNFMASRRNVAWNLRMTGSVCRITVDKPTQEKTAQGVNCTPIMSIEEIKKKIAESGEITSRHLFMSQQEEELQHALVELKSQWKALRHANKTKDVEKQAILDRIAIIDPEFYTRAETVRSAIVRVNPKLESRLQDREEKLQMIEERIQELEEEHKDLVNQMNDVKYINDCLKKQVFTMSQKPRGNIRQMCGVLKERRTTISSNSRQVAIYQIECENLDKILSRYTERISKETRKRLSKRNNKIHAKIDELKKAFPGLRSLREKRHTTVTNEEEMLILQSRIAQISTEMDAWKIQMSAANSKVDKLSRQVQQADIPVPERYP